MIFITYVNLQLADRALVGRFAYCTLAQCSVTQGRPYTCRHKARWYLCLLSTCCVPSSWFTTDHQSRWPLLYCL